jgi:hypothetical protein
VLLKERRQIIMVEQIALYKLRIAVDGSTMSGDKAVEYDDIIAAFNQHADDMTADVARAT